MKITITITILNIQLPALAMSLDSTANLKGQLQKNLGPHAQTYFDALKDFVSGKISRGEFEDATKQVLTTPSLRASRLSYSLELHTYRSSAKPQRAYNLLVRCHRNPQAAPDTSATLPSQTTACQAPADPPSLSGTHSS